MRRITILLLILYALLTAYPLVSLALGASPMGIMTPITTLAGFTFALVHACQREGWERALRLLVLVFGVSLLFESVGVATGLIYGPYHYTDKLGPLFLGLVPILIPVAWFMMSYPSFVIADWLVPAGWKRWLRLLAVAAVGGLAMTAWDLVMDPVMVAGGHWVWETDGAYFGIPLQNYWGWWLTTFSVFLVNWLAARRNGDPPRVQDDRLAVLSYIITGLSGILVCLDPDATGLGGAALAGFFAMSPWALMGWMKAGGDLI